jgi:hypothetical protein
MTMSAMIDNPEWMNAMPKTDYGAICDAIQNAHEGFR